MLTIYKYILNLNEEKVFLNSLSNQLFASCWLQLLNDESYNNDITRFKKVINIFIEFEIQWPYNIWSFLGYDYLNCLQNAAFNFIQNEEDLLNSENEIYKIWIDRSSYSGTKLEDDVPTVTLKSKNSFELLQEIKTIKSDYHYILERSDSRSSYLLALRIILDNPPGMVRSPNFHLKRKLPLLLDINKPFICWNTFSSISRDFLNLCPLLLSDIKLAPITFMILKEADSSLSNKQGVERKQELSFVTEIWLDCFKALLNMVSQENNTNKEIEKCLANIFYYKIKDVVISSVRIHYDLHIEEKRRYEGAIKELKNVTWRFCENPKRIISSIIPGLFRELKEIEPIIYFPIWRLIFCSDLIVLSQTEFRIDEKTEKEKLELERFLIDIHDYLFEEIRVSFSFDNNSIGTGRKFTIGFDSVDWYTIFLLFYHRKTIDRLFKSIISSYAFDKTGNGGIYEPQNLYLLSIIQLLGKSLSHIIISSKKPKIYRLDNELISGSDYVHLIHNKLELLVKKYCKDDLLHDRIDILKLEKSYSSETNKHGLLDLAVKAFNYSQDKTEGLETVISECDDIDRLLLISNTTTQDKTQKIVERKLAELSIEDFTEGATFEQRKNTLIEAVNSPRFSSFAGALIERLESWLNTPAVQMIKNQNINFMFEVKLLYLFKSGEITKLSELELPETQYRPDIDKYMVRKRFYLGLSQLYHDRNYSKASSTFSDLVLIEPDNFEYQYRLFDAKTKEAWKGKSQPDLINALIKWEAFVDREEGRRELNNSYLKSHIELTLVYHFISNQQYYLIEDSIARIPDYLKYQDESLELLIPFYKETGRLLNLATFLNEASYLYGGKQSEYPPILRRSISEMYSTKNLPEFKQLFSVIREMGPEEIIKVIPDDLNGKRTLEDFLLKELLHAGTILIEKIKTINSINSENKFNDILQSILRMRLDVWNWEINEQPRMGTSYTDTTEKTKDLGSPDFAIRPAGGLNFAIVEPMVLNSSNTNKITEHVTKPAEYLDHGKLFYVIAYDIGKSKSYNKRWESYKTKVLNIAYKDSIKLVNKEFDDFTDIYNLRNIKIGRTYHNDGIIISHIFFKIPDVVI